MMSLNDVLWVIATSMPPIVAGLLAGLWLAGRGHRVVGSLFLSWSVARLSCFVAHWLRQGLQRQLSVVISIDEAEVGMGLYVASLAVDLLAVAAFFGVMLRRRGGDR